MHSTKAGDILMILGFILLAVLAYSLSLDYDEFKQSHQDSNLTAQEWLETTYGDNNDK